MTVLVNYFMPKTNVIAEHHNFCKWAQMLNETVLQYVTALCELVHIFRDQLLEHT